MSAVYPNAEIRGCYFYLVKNFKKCLKNNNLLRNYNEDANFALQAKMVPAVAFVPENQIEQSFEDLSTFLPAEFLPILD